MIRVEKPTEGPPILCDADGRGQRLALQIRLDYDAGQRQFDFEEAVYGASSVKQSLLVAQKGKCAFCESKFEHIAFGDVEHFRPKGGWIQAEGDTLTRPGYYWLAYDWGNLFASCQICNQQFKRNLFPLSDPLTRARSHHDDLTSELCLLLDPSADQPELHIGFRQEYPFPLNASERGDVTIRTFGLDREELNEMRRDRLALATLGIRALIQFEQRKADGTATQEELQLLADLCMWVKTLCDKGTEYSRMFRAKLQASGLI